MIINRRQALTGAMAAGLSTALDTQEAWAQSARRIRRSASSLSATSDDVMALAEAMRRMKGRSDDLSWRAQVQLHANRAEHNNWRFLPWHRLQVSHMERIVAQISGHSKFAMPYWDWQVERFLPSWIAEPSGPLYERNRDPRAATLDFNKARFAESGDVALVTEDGFNAFCGTQFAAGRVEGFGHNIVHVLVGGLMADPRTATNDPIFWLHHCNVDRVWATWQRKNGDRLYPNAWKGVTMTGFTGADGRKTGNWQAGRITQTRSLGYEYDALYAPRVFFAPLGASQTRPVGSWTYRLSATPDADGVVRLTLPDDAMAQMRATTGRVGVEAEMTAIYARTETLAGRAISAQLVAGRGKIDLGTSTTFVHMGGEHAMHHNYGQLFTAGDAVGELARAVPEAITLNVSTEDLRPEEARAAVAPLAVEMMLTVTLYV